MNYIKELLEWSDKHSEKLLQDKAWRVHRKCLRSGRIALADKIQAKYPKAFDIKSDFAIAMGFSLIELQKLNKDESKRT